MAWSFYGKYERYEYYSPSWLINHVWDKHKFIKGFKFATGVFPAAVCSSIIPFFIVIKTCKKNIRYRFFEQNLKYFKSQNSLTHYSPVLLFFTSENIRKPLASGLQKLGAPPWACTYRALKTLIRYTKKCAPKI